MAGSMKEIKGKIESVKSSRQITKAMDVVSSTKLKKYQALTLQTRSYAESTEIIFRNILGGFDTRGSVFLSGKSEVKKVCIIVMTSDRGLCGGFNNSTIKMMQKLVEEQENNNREISVIAVGKKVIDYCKRNNLNVTSEYKELVPENMFNKAKSISEEVLVMFSENIYDEVYLIYSDFVSALRYDLKCEKILPFEVENIEKTKEYIFEPSMQNVLESFIPIRLNIKIYQALLENTASEYSARKSAMQNATDNADDIIDKLTLDYNRARQGIITQELNEIVSGTNALK